MRCSPGFLALVWCIAWQSQFSTVHARLDAICSMALCENSGWYCNRIKSSPAKDPCPVCLMFDTVNNVVQCRNKNKSTGQCPDGYSTCSAWATNTSSSTNSSTATSSTGSGSIVNSNRDDSSSSNSPPTNEATTLPSSTSPSATSPSATSPTPLSSPTTASTGTADSKKGGVSITAIILIGLAIGAVGGVGVGFVVMRRKKAQRKEAVATPQDKFQSLETSGFSPSSTSMSEPPKQSAPAPASRSSPPPRPKPVPQPRFVHDDSIESAIVPPPENLAHLDSSDIDTCDFTATGNAGMFVTSSRSDSTDWLYSTRCDNNPSQIESTDGDDGFVVFTDTNPRASEGSEPDEDDDDFYPDTDAYCADSTVPNKYLELAVESLNKKKPQSNFERQLELDAASHGPSEHEHDEDLSTARAVQFLDEDDDLNTSRDTMSNATDMIVDLSRRHPETMPGIKRDKKERLARWKDKYYLEL